jgi:hypothetical protein
MRSLQHDLKLRISGYVIYSTLTCEGLKYILYMNMSFYPTSKYDELLTCWYEVVLFYDVNFKFHKLKVLLHKIVSI